MALYPSIALKGKVTDVAGAIQSGQKITGNSMSIALQRQNQQVNAMGIAQKQAQYTNNLFTSLRDKPLDERAAIMAQNMGVLEQYGIPPSELMGNLDDAGIDRVLAATQPFMQKAETTAPAGVREFQYLTEGMNQEDVNKAKRVDLGLDARAVGSAPRIVEIGGSKYLQVGENFFNPTTTEPATLDQETGLPTGGGQAVLTPEVQTQQEAGTQAEIESATTTARGVATQELAKVDPEAVAARNKKIGITNQALGAVRESIASDRLDNVTGWSGRLPFSAPQTKDLLNTLQQLDSVLTFENMDSMTGVLSESDIKIISGIANDMGMVKDDDGNVTSVSGSYEGTMRKLKQIEDIFTQKLISQGFYPEGIVTYGADGVKYTGVGDGTLIDDGGVIYGEKIQ